MRVPSLSRVLPVVTITFCATFAAKAASHVVEATYLGEPAVATPRERPQVAAASPAPRHSKDGKQLVERNMFCSECTPPAPSKIDPSQVPITSLPLSLIATAVSRDPASSLASVVDTERHHQGAYRVGERIPGGGPIVVIRHQSLDFDNGGRVERLLLGEAQPPAIAANPPVAPPAPTTPTSPAGDALAAELEAGIRKVDDTTFEVTRSLIDRALANPVAFIKGGRAAPAMVDGKPVGFRLFAVRSGSALARLGLASGDTLTAINGFELTSMDATMNAYAKLREATSLELSIDRKGKPATLRYAIR